LALLANALLEVVEHQSVWRDTIRRRLDDNGGFSINGMISA
jgi:hypothetical protein